jgi:hypothetical protein
MADKPTPQERLAALEASAKMGGFHMGQVLMETCKILVDSQTEMRQELEEVLTAVAEQQGQQEVLRTYLEYMNQMVAQVEQLATKQNEMLETQLKIVQAQTGISILLQRMQKHLGVPDD